MTIHPKAPRQPAHTRRSGHVPGVSHTVKTIKSPHEQPIHHPTPPKAKPVMHTSPVQAPVAAGDGGDVPPSVSDWSASQDFGDFPPDTFFTGTTDAGSAGDDNTSGDAGTAVFGNQSNLVSNPSFEDDTATPPNLWMTQVPNFNSPVLPGTSVLQGVLDTGQSRATDGQNYAKWQTFQAGKQTFEISPSVGSPIDGVNTGALAVQADFLADASNGQTGSVAILLSLYDATNTLVIVLAGVTQSLIQGATTTIKGQFDISSYPTVVAAQTVFRWVPNSVAVGTELVYVDNVQLFATSNVSSVSLTGLVAMWAGIYAPSGWNLCDGSAISRTTFPDLFGKMCRNLGTVTFTNTSPTNVGMPNHGLQKGDPLRFTTTGALPTDIPAGTQFYVKVVIDANTVELNTTPLWDSSSGNYAPAGVNGFGVQSGVHTAWSAPFGLGDLSTTFNVPDYRNYVPVGHGLGVSNLASLQTFTLGAAMGDVYGGMNVEVDLSTHSHTLSAAGSFTSHTHGPGSLTYPNHVHALGSHHHSVPSLGIGADSSGSGYAKGHLVGSGSAIQARQISVAGYTNTIKVTTNATSADSTTGVTVGWDLGGSTASGTSGAPDANGSNDGGGSVGGGVTGGTSGALSGSTDAVNPGDPNSTEFTTNGAFYDHHFPSLGINFIIKT